MYSFQLFVQIPNPDDFKIRIVNCSPISFVLLRCSQGSWASDNPMTPNQLCGRCEFNSAGFLVCPPTIISSLINWDLLYQCFVPFHCALQFLHAICLALACKQACWSVDCATWGWRCTVYTLFQCFSFKCDNDDEDGYNSVTTSHSSSQQDQVTANMCLSHHGRAKEQKNQHTVLINICCQRINCQWFPHLLNVKSVTILTEKRNLSFTV